VFSKAHLSGKFKESLLIFHDHFFLWRFSIALLCYCCLTMFLAAAWQLNALWAARLFSNGRGRMNARLGHRILCASGVAFAELMRFRRVRATIFQYSTG
jgi:hypothetical protein